MSHFGWATACAGVTAASSARVRRGTAAGRGEDDLADIVVVAAFPVPVPCSALRALEDRVVLAVDGNDRRARIVRGPHQQFAGQHQRFLVRQQQALARARGGEGGIQPGGADDRGHDRVAGLAGGEFGQRPRAAGVRHRLEPGRAQAVAQGVECAFLGDHRVRGTMRAAQFQQRIDPAAGGEHAGAQRVGVAGDDVERGSPDGAGRAEDGDVAHQKPIHPCTARMPAARRARCPCGPAGHRGRGSGRRNPSPRRGA